MKKHTPILLLLFLATLPGVSQDIDKIAERKVDSLKKLLPSATGIERVDLLNSIAQGQLYIYESDDRIMHDAFKHSDEAMQLATRLRYQRGIGYALANEFYKEALKTDTNRVENARKGSHFQNAVAIANKVIKIGEELGDEILIARANDELRYMYGWKGKWEDYVSQIEKTIFHLEKAMKQPRPNFYTPLKLTDCNDCIGIEFTLGTQYRLLAETKVLFKDETAHKLRTSIAYFRKANAGSSAAHVHLRLAAVLARFNDIRTAAVEAKNALALFSTQKDDEGTFQTYQELCGLYYELGDLENGLLYGRNAVRLAETLANSKGLKNETNYPGENEFLKRRRLFQAYYWAARFYTLGGDYDNAFAYLRRASTYNTDKRWDPAWKTAMGHLYRSLGKYDSALFYLNTNTAKTSLVQLYTEMKEYDKALKTFDEIIHVVTQRNNLSNLGRLHAYAGKAHFGKKDFTTALNYAKKADAFFNTNNNNLERIDNYELLSDIYQQAGKFDSAYFYLKQYNRLKDSVLNRQFYIRLNDLRTEAAEERRTGQLKLLQQEIQIKEQLLQQQLLLKQKSEVQLTLLNKDNQIKEQQLLLKDRSLREQQFLRQQKETSLVLLDKDNKLKSQQLKQQAALRNALLGGLFLLCIVALLGFRSIVLKQKNERLLNEKRQAQLQQQSAALEMQALRAQMNPHFIFNCLSSINRYILKNESRAASDYLTRFSRLIRRVLTNSQLSMIPLADEIEMLRLYLDMERLRFDDSFEYHISYANSLEPESIYVPPMLLQPFCENAIWHGLMHRKGPGKLEISMRTNGDELHCTIIDNGIGRKRAAEMKPAESKKQQSFGLKITADRLALFNQQKDPKTFYRTEDVLDASGLVAGTKVSLVIHYKDFISEPINEGA